MKLLYIDDVHTPQLQCWDVVRSSKEALEWVDKNGIPDIISFDHDLGGDDTSMVFLKNLYEKYPDGYTFKYHIHSDNPIGKLNIKSFIDSWKRANGINTIEEDIALLLSCIC
jgi:hypothetical protein